VAERDGQWVALLAFSAPALPLQGRERWIGWSARQRARRLGLVVNNSRFLVLPDRKHYPNLASRVLGLGLRRLRADWQAHWGHPVLGVESFVDASQYRGTCYRACGFEPVGATGGFARVSRDFYEEHGQPKQLYLRALVPAAPRWLRQPRLPAALAPYEAEVAGPCPFRAPALESLRARLGALPDAMPCQQASARFITQEWGGDYLFGLKGNQSGIEERAQRLLAQQGFPPSGPVGKGPRTD
jgi:hypothetical protein